MKKKNTLKIAVLLVAILLVALVSFVGIYKYDKGNMINILPEYELGKELKGSRLITMNVDTSTEKNDNESTEEATETESVETPVNAPEVLTAENYQLCKEIINQRMKELNVEEYDLRLNAENGTLVFDMQDTDKTDEFMSLAIEPGKFEIIDTDTKEVLLNKDDLNKAEVMYYGGSNDGTTTVYLDIKFNKDSAQKLEEVTKKYTETTDTEGKKIKKTITIQIDDEKLLTTYFGETISNGELQMPIGEASADRKQILEYAESASYIAMLLNSQTLPIKYANGENQFVSAVVDNDMVKKIIVIAIIITAVIIAYMCIRFGKRGILAGIAFVGYIAIVMLLIRVTNVQLAIGSLIAIAVSVIMEAVLMNQLLKANGNKEMTDTLINTTLTQIPLYVISIVLCFMTLVPMVSFGTALFWGVIVATIYNYLVGKNLLED